MWEANEHFGTGAAEKAMLRLVLEAHTCNASTYFSLASGVLVDKNKTVTKKIKSIIPKLLGCDTLRGIKVRCQHDKTIPVEANKATFLINNYYSRW